MKTDRELLEAAAKSAGIKWDRDAEVWYGEPFVRNDWNPLTDDGDVLRLAVKLNLLNEYHMDQVAAMVHFDATNPDPYEATRRAIVCAAAARVAG